MEHVEELKGALREACGNDGELVAAVMRKARIGL
jgi:hypothetical protein